MLAAPPQISFSQYAAAVQEMVESGLSLVDVEGAVADAELTADSKAALWLLAWADPRRDGIRELDVPPADSPARVTRSGRVVPLRRGA